MSNQKESKGRADNVDKHVSRRLKMRRLMLGMSQQDLANAVDVSIQQVQKYEKAMNRISSGKLFAFAKFLKVPVEYFYEDTDQGLPFVSSLAEESVAYVVEQDENSVSEKEIINLIRAFSEIKNPQGRKKIIELVKAMS
jgi:transcriptional regulator with XRE-family HTH domain